MIRQLLLIDVVMVLVFLTVLAISVGRKHFSSEKTPVEKLKERHANGEIDHQQFERELEYHLDDRNERIQVTVETASGIGPEFAEAIAREFESVDELRNADRERLESINDIGESRADAVLDAVR